jgi:alpha-L-arabinofuranosidase
MNSGGGEMTIRRRQFLRDFAVTSAVLVFSPRKACPQSVDSHIEILPDEPLGLISRNLYGHFTEHIGGVIYDGVWVGEASKIPNRYGIRSQLVEALKQLRVPVIRWPGGCFADSYDWKDGVGPASKRPRRTNFWEVDPDAARLHERGAQIFETNEFGTNEFIRLCRLTGAEPYIAANVRSLPAMEFDHWVEYCNSPPASTALANLRQQAGFPDPFNVHYWGVGNESWGCGGNFSPEDYASEFRRFTAWVPSFGIDPRFIGSGPNDDDSNWTRRFFEKIYSIRPYDNPRFFGWSIHHYAWNLSRGKSEDWQRAKGDALEFDSVDWYELLRESDRIEQILLDQWSVIGEYDRRHQIKLVVDEYGPWYREGTEVDKTHIFGQQITLRDALATALTLDTFNRHPEKVGMATCAQMVNNLNALFLTRGEQFVTTPNYHIFEMYSEHQDAQALRAEFFAPEIHYSRNGQDVSFWGLKGSASRKGNLITLTIVNPNVDKSQVSQIAVRGASVKAASGIFLGATDIHAHNTFEQPSAVQPQTLNVSVSLGLLNVTLPAASVTKLQITVG